jgi:hypothetical protein
MMPSISLSSDTTKAEDTTVADMGKTHQALFDGQSAETGPEARKNFVRRIDQLL